MSDEHVSQRMLLAGRYQVEQELGRGGMAKVFKGTDTVLGRPVAIKILAPQFADDANFVTRFRREAQAAARLNHPNLVQVYDTGSDDGIHFIVMEYVEAKTLADYLAGGSRIMPQRAIELAEATLDALAVAHAQGIIHRDVKPANVMVTRDGEVKVTDFGIARVTSNETVAQTAAVLGTASYLSPEQAQGQPVDQRSDIYSLGCVLYEMVAGRPPFQGDSAVSVASKHVIEQPTPPSKLNPDVSSALDAVIMRALSKNPTNRYQTAEEMKADLQRVRLGQPVLATPLLPADASTQVISRAEAQHTAVLPPTERAEPVEPGRTSGWIVALIVFLVLAVIGGLLYLFAKNVLSSDTKNPPAAATVTVPPVEGLSLRDAQTKLEDAKLSVGTVDRQVPDDPTVQPGTVLSQDPPADTKVKQGSKVNLVVAKAGTVTIPSGLTGQPADQVQSQLETLGLQVTQQPESSADIDPGNVTRTDPAEGADVQIGSSVTIFVSSGPGTVTVPEVTCLSFNAALNRLRQEGLNGVTSDQTVDLNPNCPLGNKVAAQDPAPGTQANEGDTVTLYPGAEPTSSPSPTEEPTA